MQILQSSFKQYMQIINNYYILKKYSYSLLISSLVLPCYHNTIREFMMSSDITLKSTFTLVGLLSFQYHSGLIDSSPGLKVTV